MHDVVRKKGRRKRIDYFASLRYDGLTYTDSDVTGDGSGITTVEHRIIRPVAWAKSKHAVRSMSCSFFVIIRYAWFSVLLSFLV